MNFLSKISLTLGLLGIIIFSSFSGTIVNAANQYTSYFSSSRQKVLNTWIQNKIVSRKSTLSPAEYKTFISGLSTKLNNLLANTNLSSNHRNTYGYILSEVDAIKNTTSTSANPTCNSEQTLVNGVCQNLRHTCPDGSIVAINRQCAVMQNQSSLITTLVHSPDYPSLTRSIVTPATSYKEMLEWGVNGNMTEPEWGKDERGNSTCATLEGYSLEHHFGCLAKINNMLYNDKYRDYSEMSQPEMTAFIMAKSKACSGGDKIYVNNISVMKEHIYLQTCSPKRSEGDTITFSLSSSAWKSVTPGNESKGRIWVPAGVTIRAGGANGYGPQSIIAYRWNGAPEGGAAAVRDIETTTTREEFF